MKKLRYYPELNKISGGITSTLVMLQLEYWFEKIEGNTFFKFLEPCQDNHYKVGDSWCEELGFSKGEFRTAFGKIGKVYKSKKEFNESQDKFDGKLYLSYFDRIKRLTFYMRNEELVNEYLDLQEEGKEICRSEEAESPISVESFTNHLHHKKSALPYEEILEAYHETCEELPRVEQISYRLNKNLSCIWKWVHEDIEKIKALFVKVKESDFLSGRIAGKSFIATLEWMMQRDKFEDILKGKYAVNFGRARDKYELENGKAREVRSPKKNKGFTRMMAHNWDFNQLEALEQEYIEKQVTSYSSMVSPLLKKIRRE